uniref:Envoplakin a n=1 Tax=Fundulus heteroclitus TaxID=8078 RepID=A0A3Q2PG61_FUNHE
MKQPGCIRKCFGFASHQGEESSVQNCEQLLTDLKRRSTTISPLKLRRISSNRPTTVEALCDWGNEQVSLSKGETFTLKSFSDNENWDVISSSGATKTFPGVCFQIPPPDPDAIDKVNLLGNELADIKKRRAALEASLKNHKSDVSKVQQSGVCLSLLYLPDSHKNISFICCSPCVKLRFTQKQCGLRRQRAGLMLSGPISSLQMKIKFAFHLEVKTLKDLEQQIETVQADLQPLLSTDPNNILSGLPLKLTAARNKYDGLAALADLYNKKANASLNLENQIQKVDGLVSGFERNLSEDGLIPDIPNAIQITMEDIQQRSVARIQGNMMKLDQDLEMTEKLCSSLRHGYQEYCPDIQRQRNDVKQLHNRYTNVTNQLKERDDLLQEASSKHLEFRSLCKYLNSSLDSLPTNQMNISDGPSQVTAKQSSQQVRTVMKDLKQMDEDMDRVVDLSQDLQDLLNSEGDKLINFVFCYILDILSPIKKIKLHWKSPGNIFFNLMNMFLLLQNEEKVQLVAQQQVELGSQQINDSELDSLLRELEEEKERTALAQTELKALINRMMSIKSQRSEGRVEEREILQYYRDPKLESDLAELRNKLNDEVVKQSSTQTEIETVNQKLSDLQDTIEQISPTMVTREVFEFERDPELDEEASKMRHEIARTRHEIRMKEREQIQLKKEITILQQNTPHVKQRAVGQEDPEMSKALTTFETEISEEKNKCRLLNNEIFQTRNQINTLEKLIPDIQSKTTTRKVKTAEQDPDLIAEFSRLQTSLEKERSENSYLSQEVMELQRSYREVQDKNPSFKVKEVVNEIYLVDPNTEMEIMHLRKEIQDSNVQYADLENKIKQVTNDRNRLHLEKPRVELKEVLQEVVKVERSPENEREIQRLNDQVNRLDSQCTSLEDQVRQLRKQRDEWKAEMSKIETQLVNREVIKYEHDPLLEKEADRLRRTVREEAKMSLRKEALFREKDDLTRVLRTLEAKKHDICLSFQQRSRLMSERTQMNKQRSLKMESDVQRLEKQILEEKDKIHQRDSTIHQILMYLQKEEQGETRTKETNVSTKITILDPETGKDMSPYDAYRGGLVDRQQYIHLQELECDWEEITSSGPDGETSVLQDRKSGKQYPIKDALNEGRLTEYDLQLYKQGRFPISEFALLVAGDKNKQPKFNSFTPKPNPSLKSPSLDLTSATKTLPIAGIMDKNTNTCFTIHNATLGKLIDHTTAQRLLEAQAATGGIIDISNNQRYKVHKAAQRGLIDDSQVQRLLNAEKAFTGVEDPVTKEVLSVGEAVQKGWMPKDSAIRYMEAQHLTGGLVDPNNGTRVALLDAIGSKMIDSTTTKDLQNDELYIRVIIDPITKEKINYKQALQRCKKDPASGLPMLPASSKGSGQTPTYSSSIY